MLTYAVAVVNTKILPTILQTGNLRHIMNTKKYDDGGIERRVYKKAFNLLTANV